METSASVLFFDDSPENVAGAVDAGMQAVHVTSSDSVRSALDALTAAGPTPHGVRGRRGRGLGFGA